MMANRTPNYMVVGLVMVVFLLGSFYISCSSKTRELKRVLARFEERMRSLSLRTNDKDKVIDSHSAYIKNLEEHKLQIQRELDKKDIEIIDLNADLRRRVDEIKNLRMEKKYMQDELVEYKNALDVQASKDLTIKDLQRELRDLQKLNQKQLDRLKEEIMKYRRKLNLTRYRDGRMSAADKEYFERLLSFKETVYTSSVSTKRTSRTSSKLSHEIHSITSISPDTTNHSSLESIDVANNISSMSNDTDVASNILLHPTSTAEHDMSLISTSEIHDVPSTSASETEDNPLAAPDSIQDDISETSLSTMHENSSLSVEEPVDKNEVDQNLGGNPNINSTLLKLLQQSLDLQKLDNDHLNNTFGNFSAMQNIRKFLNRFNLTSIPFLNETHTSEKKHRVLLNDQVDAVEDQQERFKLDENEEQK